MKGSEILKSKFPGKNQIFNNKMNDNSTQKNYNFGDVKIVKRDFFKGFFEGLTLAENEYSQTINDYNIALQRLYKNGKIDVFELNALENYSNKLKNAVINLLTSSDFIAVGIGEIWRK